MAEELSYQLHSEFNDKYGTITRKIVRMLSENSRISISDLAKNTGLSRRTVSMRLKKIEQELGIRYTVELDYNKLGLTSPHIVFVELKEKPDYEYVEKVLKKSPIPQIAFSVKGKNAILIYGIATSTSEYVYWDNAIAVLLARYGTLAQTSEVVHTQLGFFPLRNEMLEKSSIAPKYKEMLKILNENSRVTFQELSKRLSMHFNTVAYTFNKLLKMNYIKRFTITMDKPDYVSTAAFLVKYTPKEDFEKQVLKVRRAFQSDDENTLISRYIVLAPLIGSYDHFGVGVFDDFKTATAQIAKYHKQALGNNIAYVLCYEIDKMLIGRLPLRSVDDKKDYNVIDWTVGEEMK